MEKKELYTRIMMNKPTGWFASLPAAFSDDAGNKGLTWFYYDDEELNDGHRLGVRQLAVADENLNFQISNSEWTFDFEEKEEALSELSIEEYYDLLEALLDKMTEEGFVTQESREKIHFCRTLQEIASVIEAAK